MLSIFGPVPRPEEIGGVPIVWFSPSVKKGERRFAGRYGRELCLPIHKEAIFIPVGCAKGVFVDGNTDDELRKYSFCGKDGGPFHANITRTAYDALTGGGLSAFLECLVPKIIRQMSKHGKIQGPFFRQGDWFALPLPFTWEEVKQATVLVTGHGLWHQAVHEYRLGGTRHRLSGNVAEGVALLGKICTIAEGVIRAPDHEDLVLQGPHAIAQAANLTCPEEVD